MMWSRFLASPLMLAFLLGACDSVDVAGPAVEDLAEDPLETVLTAAAGETDARGRQHAGGAASLFDELAAAIPGFGGLYRTAPCHVVVVLTDLAEEELAVRVVHAAVSPLVARPCPGGVRVGAQRGTYTYVELQRFLGAAHPLLRIPGVHRVRIDYSLNKLVFFVESRRAAAAVLDALADVGIPEGAVAFRTAAAGQGGGRTGTAG